MLALLATCLPAATSFFPLASVKPGLKGIGKTVFAGDRVEQFNVEILGVLENFGPKESVVLARLSGGPLAGTGVLQGMSGSPVYIGGQLLGAVAMAFPFSKEPIAGIRPIEEMIKAGSSRPPRAARARLTDSDLLAALSKPLEEPFGSSRLIDIATPVSFSGFTRHTVEQFAPKLRALGLEPLQGVSGGGSGSSRLGDPSALKPGSMISVELIAGDMNVGADGTVTHIDGDKVYAFGHRFLSVGPTDLPFARAEVLALLPSLSSSFKIDASRELLGSMTDDRNTAISGRLGRRAALVPVSISVSRAGRPRSRYRLQMVDDRFLSPFLLQVCVFSAIDATERTLGPGTFVVKGKIEFNGVPAPLVLDNIYSSETGSALQVSLAAAIPLAYVLQGGFDSLAVRNVSLDISSFDDRRQAQIDQVFPARREVRPGEDIELTIALAGENGAEITRHTRFHVPIGLTPGPLFFTVADATTVNFSEMRQIFAATPRTPGQLVTTVNNLKNNTKAYVRVWRPDPAYQIQGEEFPAPPPSLALILARSQPGYGGLSQLFNSRLAEMEVDGGGGVVTGSKTVQVEVKE